MTFHMNPTPTDRVGGFVAGDTTIAMIDGNHRTVAELVEDLHQGVHHRACALQPDGTVVAVEVKDVRREEGESDTVMITFDDGAVLHCSPGQLLLDPSGEWVSAKALTAGAVLFTTLAPHTVLGRPIDVAAHAASGARRTVASAAKSTPRAWYQFHVATVHNLATPSGVYLHD
jgi:DNA gyrase subunit B